LIFIILSECEQISQVKVQDFILMEYITLRLDSTNEAEQRYIRHNYLYCLIT